MDSYKSPRFWLALSGLVSVSVLAGIGVFSAELAAGLLVGLLSGVGVSTPLTAQGARRAGAISCLAVAGIGGALMLGGCGGGGGGPDAVVLSALVAMALLAAASASVVVMLQMMVRRWRRAAREERSRGDLARAANNRLRKKLIRAGISLGCAMAIALSPGCAAFGSGGKADPAAAMRMACSYHSAASSVARLVCSHLPDGQDRSKCMRYHRLASQAASVALGIAAAHLGGSCDVDATGGE